MYFHIILGTFFPQIKYCAQVLIKQFLFALTASLLVLKTFANHLSTYNIQGLAGGSNYGQSV